jgi:2-polyprenyl-3-methyl-5-hydroxy-6-metoxy-1,4-benzoquinol methylase
LASDFNFDKPDPRRFVEARQAMLRPVLEDLHENVKIRSVADVGCGVGYFSGYLRALGFDVVGFDGRAANAEEARRRFPEIQFHTANVEDESILRSSSYDMVFCVGLLYHLENPMRALRNLSTMAKEILLIESYSTPDRQTAFYLREEPILEDQSLTYLALYPSESSLIKICYKIGFESVYRFVVMPDHEDFRDRPRRKRQRTMLLASRTRLDFPYLVHVPEPQDFSDPWETPLGKILRSLGRVRRWVTESPSMRRLASRGNTEVGSDVRR